MYWTIEKNSSVIEEAETDMSSYPDENSIAVVLGPILQGLKISNFPQFLGKGFPYQNYLITYHFVKLWVPIQEKNSKKNIINHQGKEDNNFNVEISSSVID